LAVWAQANTHLQLDPNVLKQVILQHLKASNGAIAKNVWFVFKHSSSILIKTSINVVLVPIIAVYLLRDWQTVTTNIKALLPRQQKAKLLQMGNDCGEVLGAFFRGQLLVMIALGIIYSIGLTIVGLDLSLIIGIGAGLLSIVPYLGFIIGFVVSLADVVVKYHSWWYVLYVCIVFAIGHVAESYILQPWLVGRRIGLHPVAVIFAVMSGGVLFGLTGVLVALPVAAVIMVILRYLRYQVLAEHFD